MVTGILNWSEIWALLIPLYYIITQKTEQHQLKPVKYYIISALIINFCIDIISNQKDLSLNLPWHNNNLLYNLHSIFRFAFFCWFFISLKPKHNLKIKKIIALIYYTFLLSYYTFHASIFTFSSLTIGLELYALLVYCLFYYWQLLKQDLLYDYKKLPEFWIVTGLGIFIVISLVIILFYNKISETEALFAIKIWNIHNIAYILLSIFLAKGFYHARYIQPTKLTVITTDKTEIV